MPAGRTLFNIGMPKLNQQITRRISASGVIQIRCDVHPWEEAYVLSIPHPYHTVSNAKGDFEISQIPPGTYTLVCWHEKLGEKKRKITLKSGESFKLTLSYPALKVR
jgi:hypothetical protein